MYCRRNFVIKNLFLLSVFFTGLFLSIAFAEEKEKSYNEGLLTVRKLSEAYELVRYGREEKSFLSLLTAAEIIGTSQIEEDKQITVKKNIPPEEDTAVIKEEYSYGEEEACGLIEEAIVMSENNPAVVAVSDIIRKKTEEYHRNPESKGTHGAVSAHSLLSSYESEIWNIPCYPGEEAAVEIIGDGSSNLDIFVYDGCNNLIVMDNNKSDRCSVTWVPEWKEKFQTEVVNMNDKSNKYIIIYNY